MRARVIALRAGVENTKKTADTVVRHRPDATPAADAAPAPEATPQTSAPAADVVAKSQESEGKQAHSPQGQKRGEGRGKGPRGPKSRGPRSRGKKPQGPGAGAAKAPVVPHTPLNTFDASGDFAAMLEEQGDFKQMDVRRGQRINATLAHIAGDTAFFELGAAQDAWMSLAEILDDNGEQTVAVGDTVTCFVLSTGDSVHLSRKLSGNDVDILALEEAQASGIPVEGKVTGHNKGGLEITVAGGARGFCPMGQADLNYVENPASFVGKTMQYLITQIKGKELTLSRKKLLQKDREEKAKKTLETLEVGSIVDGVIRKLESFGAFIDIGGVDGLLPASEIGWGQQNVAEAFNQGDSIRVEVRRIEDNPKRPGTLRISLSRKALLGDPLTENQSQMQEGASLTGKVTRIDTFGAFVELFPGVEGLIHISEMSYEHVRHPSDVVKEGDILTVRVKSVDTETRRIGLSLKDPGDAPVDNSGKVKAGAKVTGIVRRHERYGVFVDLKEFEGVSALLPASESGTERGADLRRVLPEGKEMDLTVIEVDDRGRVRVSQLARVQQEERELIQGYQKDQGGGGGQGLGTMADLFKKKSSKKKKR